MFHDAQVKADGLSLNRPHDSEVSTPIVQIWLEARQRQQDLIDEAMQLALHG